MPPPEDRRQSARRHHDRLFHAFFTQGRAGMAVLTPQGQFQMVNPALCTLLGYDEATLLRMDLPQITYGPDIPRDLSAMEQAGGMPDRSLTHETRNVQRDGTIIWTRLTLSLFTDQDGAPPLYLAQFQDITPSKALEQDMLAKREFIGSILDSLSAHIAILDPDGTIIKVNGPWLRFAHDNGMPPNWTGIGVNYLDTCWHAPSDDRSRPLAIYAAHGIKDVLEHRRTSFTCEYRCDSATQNRWFQMRVTPLHSSEGRVVISHDEITSLKRSEVELRASRRQLQSVLNNSPALIGYWDRSLHSVFANHAYYEWLGVRPDQVIGRHVTDVLTEELYRQNIPYMQKALNGERQEFERNFPSLSGGPERRALVRYIPDVQNGEVQGFYVHISDFTAIKVAEEKLRQDDRQQEVNRIRRLELQKDAVIREVHHRIKNHLQGVIGLIQERVRTMPEVAPQLKEAMTQVRTIAEVYGLQSHDNKGNIPLTQLISMAARSSMGGKPVRCHLPTTDDPVLISQNDAVPLALLINELLTNAIKHSDPSGENRPVQLWMDTTNSVSCIQIRNGPAYLPDNFSLSHNSDLGTGLELAKTLLPSKGASLSLQQDGDEVVAELTLSTPPPTAPD